MIRAFTFLASGGDAGSITGGFDLSIEPEQKFRGAEGAPEQDNTYSVIVADLGSSTKWQLTKGRTLEDAETALVVSMVMYEAGHLVVVDEQMGMLYNVCRDGLLQAFEETDSEQS